MLHHELLLHIKLAPPRLRRRTLRRTTLTAKLHEALDYRLTLLQAGTGYGKSTALAALAEGATPLCWLSLAAEEADPQRFLSYLIAAFRVRLPALSAAPSAILQEISHNGSGAWSQALDALVNALLECLAQPTLLVLDDYHFVAHAPEVNALVERFLIHLPPHLHVVIASRQPFVVPSLVTWRAKGDVLELGREALAFRPAEIETLFRETYGMSLSADTAALLADKTEGWPIALQLIWQDVRHDTTQPIAHVLQHGPASLNALFDYLARDVLERQPPSVAQFLRATAVLRELTPEACNAVTASSDSATMLEHLHNHDLFVVALGERHYRYHHLFHDFLRAQLNLNPDEAHTLHRRAAEFFQSRHQTEEAIYHWLSAHDFAPAAEAIEAEGETTLRAGRLDTLATWIDALPPAIVAEHPLLQAYLGDVYRLRSRFDEALNWYVEAERTWRARNDPSGISRALRGQATIYLDTVRPAQAESLLEEALRLNDRMSDRAARARLLELLAENKLNMGKPHEAEALRREARTLREEGPSEDVLGVRVKLRTGRLDEAQHILAAWVESERRNAEQGQTHPPRAHRETVLLLSLIQSFRGEAERAFTLAQEGMALGERLGSPFVTAVGRVRLGHAWQLRCADGRAMTAPPRYADAIQCYQAAIVLGDKLAVRRTRAEAMWGLTRAYGFTGDLVTAQQAATEGAEIGRWAGDPWIVALIETALGASLVLAEREADALEVLSRAWSAFRDCGDSFGRAATRLWLSLACFKLKQTERFLSCIEELLTLCETHGYEFLFKSPTLLGPPDPRCFAPALLMARAQHRQSAYVKRLLAELGLSQLKAHAGYSLRVQTLGAFRVWRGTSEVSGREWQRDKARQLFQLLLTQRGRWLQRDEIIEMLWPQLAPEAAQRDFKVALNALNKALEPTRPPDAPFAFITRDGAAYRLPPDADVWLDCVAFERACESGLSAHAHDEAISHLQAAMRWYQGDYLPEALYDDWASAERERLLSLYLRAADRLAGLLLERQQYDESINICQAILARDACWEHAYSLLMQIYARQGNRAQALRIYQRCVTTLREQLTVEPSPATMVVYEQISMTDRLA
jgi:DNA-binding SARP family transcriptional activator